MRTPSRRGTRKSPIAVLEDANRTLQRVVWLCGGAGLVLAAINIYNLALLVGISRSIG